MHGFLWPISSACRQDRNWFQAACRYIILYLTMLDYLNAGWSLRPKIKDRMHRRFTVISRLYCLINASNCVHMHLHRCRLAKVDQNQLATWSSVPVTSIQEDALWIVTRLLTKPSRLGFKISGPEDGGVCSAGKVAWSEEGDIAARWVWIVHYWSMYCKIRKHSAQHQSGLWQCTLPKRLRPRSESWSSCG